MTGTTHSALPTTGVFLQFDVRPGKPEANLAAVSRLLDRLQQEAPAATGSLVVLPELWATGFAYPKLASLAGNTPSLLKALQDLAIHHRVILAGSLPEADAGRFHNTLYVTGPTGTIGQYRKQHLFAPMGEDTFFSPGQPSHASLPEPSRLAGMVCYDLRFPEIARRQAADGAVILLVSAQWPLARLDHWQVLVQARAIENQMFVIAANRCGSSDDTEFAGHSMIVAPDGTILQEAGKKEGYGLAVLDHTLLEKVRSRFNTVPPATASQ